ncbi:MAG TPA: energy transducer TonB [Acidobacteriaceae bacterium]|nr:energy transducer TonB [Acidobacteriaceae bacterium]
MNRRKMLGVVLMCFGFSLVYAAAQTQPAAGPPASAPTPPSSSAKTAVAPLPDPQTPQEFFARARALSDLEASGIPFHLKATYVASGDAEFTGNGTYEEWWESKDLWRKEATLGDYKYVVIQSGGKNTVYGSSDYIPLRLRQMLDAVVIRIVPNTGTARKWKLKHKKLKGVDLAVLSSEYECGDGKYKAKCLAEDYFTQGGVLRIHLEASVEAVYNGIHEFQELEIPHSVVVAGDNVEILTISIASLEPLNPSESVLLQSAKPPANLPAIRLPLVPDEEKSAGIQTTSSRITSQTQPVYPLAARQQRMEGTVVIDATIDEEGRIREPFVIGSASPILDMAAMDAIRKWRYQPTTLDGAPICVNTTISVKFALGRLSFF